MKKKRKNRKPQGFPEYMMSFENKDPDYPNPYRKWTVKVRQDMEREGTWALLGSRETIQAFMAEYLSRILAEFWGCNKQYKWYEYQRGLGWKFNNGKILQLIYERLRKKGLKNELFSLPTVLQSNLPRATWIEAFGRWDKDIIIRPYAPFNDHGAGI